MTRFLVVFLFFLVLLFAHEIADVVERVEWFLRGWRACVRFHNIAWRLVQWEVSAPLAYEYEKIANQVYGVIKKRLRKDWTEQQDRHALWQVQAQLVYISERWKGVAEEDAFNKVLAQYR